jgi:hypothetical protein
MKIAFVLIAEAYQCYHGAAIAFELAAMPDVEVAFYYNDPETPLHLERIRKAWGAPPLPVIRMKRTWAARAIQAMKVFGLAKPQVLAANEAELAGFDAIFALEDSAGSLFAGKERGKRPARIHMSHGSGDRAVGFSPRIAAFDLVLLTGRKTADRLLSLGYIQPGGYALPGYAKIEVADRLRASEAPLFASDRPVVLYNPHKARGLSSWRRFIGPMLKGFAAQDRFDLIVAPHVKMFRRRSERLRNTWRRRSTPHILIDPGSERSLDNSYTAAADIYVGDVSSQVYEFLARPRPCVFLNAHGIDWREDPDFRFWRLGDVVEDPADLMEAIDAAPARHGLYRAAQEEAAAASLGDLTPGGSRRAAEAIVTFLRDGSVEP